MSKTLVPWLAGTAAIVLLAGAGAAAAQDPAEAARQAAADARAAAEQARANAHEAREKAQVARKKAHEAAEHARKEVRIYRSGPGGDVHVFHGGDREAHLRTMLQLRPEQEPALKAYVEAVGKGRAHGDHMVRFDRRDGEGRTTVERLAEMESRLAEQQAAMRRRIDATKTFYGQLDDRQKKVFDSMPMLMFAGPGFGPMLLPVGHVPPTPPVPPVPPAPRL